MNHVSLPTEVGLPVNQAWLGLSSAMKSKPPSLVSLRVLMEFVAFNPPNFALLVVVLFGSSDGDLERFSDFTMLMVSKFLINQVFSTRLRLYTRPKVAGEINPLSTL